jgi:hypothetical protein
MSYDYYGTPGAIYSLPTPAAEVNITSSTDATPIVVTTATAHGLQTDQAVVITDHATNTNANGVHLAHVLSSTTYSLYTLAGVAVAGNGAGNGSGGTSQSLGLPGIQLVEDATDAIDAASVNVPLEGLADMVAWLALKVLISVRILKGGILQVLAGSAFGIAPGAYGFIEDRFEFSGSPSVPARLVLGSRSRFNVPPRRLSNANHTVNCSTDGPVVILDLPTATRTITIDQASDTVKEDGDIIDFYIPRPPTSVAGTWVLKREGSANTIATYGGTVDGGSTFWPGYVRIHLEGGVWRFSGGSMGVTPGTDA